MNVPHVTFIFNKECNWNCEYCNQKLDDKTHVSEEVLYNNFEKYSNYFLEKYGKIYLILTGGEPGLWSDFLWEKILNFISENFLKIVGVLICSNGEIFKKDIFKTAKLNVFVLWHVSENMDNVVSLPENISDESGFSLGFNVFPITVLTKKNMENLEFFLSNNSFIKELTIDLFQNSKFTDFECSFSKQDLNDIIKLLIKNGDKINSDSIKAISLYKNRFDNKSEIYATCREQKNKWLIDLQSNKIYGCCQYKDSIPLNINNLKIKMGKNCKGCFNPTMLYQEFKNAT